MENTEFQISKFNSQKLGYINNSSMTLEQQSRIIAEEGTDVVGLSDEISPEMAKMLDGHQSALTVALYRSLID